MSTKLHLKRAAKDDLPLVERVLKENHLPFEDVSTKLDSMFLVYYDSRVVGVGGLEVYGEIALLRSMAIEGPYRARGYGKWLFHELVKQAKAKGVKEIYLLTTSAPAFFERLGFKRTNRNEAPLVIQATAEFKELCPSTSVCMKMRIQ